MSDLPPVGHSIPEPGSYDFPDEEQERRRAAEASLRDDRFREVENALMSTASGREWVWAILNSLHTFEQRIAMSGTEYENAFLAGERDVGVRLLSKFARSSPENFARMFAEQDRA